MPQERAEKRIDELPVLSEVTGTEELPISDNGVAKKVTVGTLLAGAESGQGLTEEIKTALLTIAQKVAYIDEHGQTYYDALYNALYPPATLLSISAVFAQGNRTIFSNEPLNSLKQWLTVTAVYDDGSTEPVADEDYSLSGTLEDGTSAITATYEEKTSVFNVSVTGYDIPEGYTAYDYIQKKNTTAQTVPKNSFIWLNDQTDLNELSLETKIAIKGTTQQAPALFGVRNAADWMTSYSVYCNETQGIAGALRGVAWETGYFLNQTPTVFEIINPSVSPAYWRINGGDLHEIPWDSTFAIPHGFAILNNVQYNATSKNAINVQARIGYIILRKADGECVGYYVPTVYEGKIGMYDIVSKQFYTAVTASVVTIEDSGCLYDVGNWT